ncbi:hypothetical protein CN326_20310 [Bacillus sp. AFS018417]|uniref:hypothetical protein n=1 Tax=Bacillus TaxID=1386 RepID=UPI000BF66DD8|nr:hypothetical protein [Bacillus sp. AFS018417]PEZ02223.1 hypothetical protein CN326_20310 [Bacillus sp. AFS018417]
MQKNARGHVQDSCQALHEAKNCLQSALQTVEKSDNRQRIEQSLQAVQHALQQCDSTADILSQE